MRTLLVGLLLIATPAFADGVVVEGTINGAPKHAVVWLEGVPAASWTLPATTPVMSQRGAKFAPDFLVVVVGQTVRMPNDDRLIHNVFSISTPKKFDLGHYSQGESRSVTFEKPGIVDLFCNIHENMHATIVVVPSTFYAVADDSGHFSIRGVPPGTYTVRAYSPDAGAGTTNAKVGSSNVQLRFALEKK
jgi:plastocyanin